MVTIAIPAYKVRFLATAIKSVLAQTDRDFELIILNDGSPEDVESIVKSFSDVRIRYFANATNVGRENLVATWNQCLSLALGEWFHLFSDDDVLEPEYILQMVSLMKKYPGVLLAHCRVRVIDAGGVTVGLSTTCPEWESGAEFVWHRMKDARSQYASDFLCSTFALRSIGGFVDFPLAWGSDESTWASLAFPGGIAYAGSPLLCWRRSGVNISQIGDPVSKLVAITSFEGWFFDFLRRMKLDADPDAFLIQDSLSLLSKRTNDMRTTAVVRSSQQRLFPTIWVIMFCIRHLRLLGFDLRLIVKSVLYSVGLAPYQRTLQP